MSAKATGWNHGTVDFVVGYGRVTYLLSILSRATKPCVPANRAAGTKTNRCLARKVQGKKIQPT